MHKVLRIFLLLSLALLLFSSNSLFAQGWWGAIGKQFPAQTDFFTIEFDVVPRDEDIGVARTHITLSDSIPGDWGHNACIIRFVVAAEGEPNYVDVRNGGTYEADEFYDYYEGVVYHCRMEVDPVSDFYSVYVKELPDGEEVLLKDGSSFRTDQAGVGRLQYVNVMVPLVDDTYNSPGSELKNIVIKNVGGDVLWEDEGTEYVPSADFGITMDAQRDEWYNTLTGPADGFLYLPPESEGTTGVQPDDETDCSALIWQAWDETYYYFYAEVKDDYVVVNNTTTYENDNIELKIDPDPSLSDETTTGVAATRMSALSADDAEVPEAVQNVDSGEMDSGDWAPEEGVDYARIETDAGYNLEWKIPWEAIQKGDRAVNVGVDEIFGLAINVGDNDDTGRDHVLRWASDLGDLVWNEPKRHGTVTFKENNILSFSTENAITGEDTNTVNYQPATAVAMNPVQAPAEYALAQNYPNPFNPSTTIPFSMNRTGHVTIAVYNTIGQKIATLVDDVRNEGVYHVNWNGTNAFGEKLSSGVYFISMTTDNFSCVQKALLVQ